MTLESAVQLISKMIKEESKYGVQQTAWDVIKKELAEGQKPAANTQSAPCPKCQEFDNSEYRFCPWCGLVNSGRHSARL